MHSLCCFTGVETVIERFDSLVRACPKPGVVGLLGIQLDRHCLTFPNDVGASLKQMRMATELRYHLLLRLDRRLSVGPFGDPCQSRDIILDQRSSNPVGADDMRVRVLEDECETLTFGRSRRK